MRRRGKRARSGAGPERAMPEAAQAESAPSEISVIAYTDEAFEERKGVSVDEIAAYLDRPGVVWIDVNGLGSPAAVERICALYKLHPLTIEDALTANMRPKLDVFDGYASVVFEMFYLHGDGPEVVTEKVSLVFGPRFVLSFQEKPIRDVFDPVRGDIRSRRGRIRKAGADHLAYSLVDAVVDNYLVVLDRLSEDMEAVEDEVLATPTQETLRRMHALRNQIIFLRKSAWPLRDVLDRLQHDAEDLVAPGTVPYLRDLSAHTAQVMEQIEVMRDIVTNMLELYLSSLSYNLNSVLKRLTLITTIFMPLSVLAGVGGMSEWTMMTGAHNWWWTYPLFLLGLVGVGAASYLWLKKKNWV
jgi:magnesium transporter